MVDENQYQFPPPSDPDLTTEWLALKPGDYTLKTDLLKYTKPLLNDYELTTPVPVGVGDYDSVVYVYPQGTIEVIGQVYCWNRLIRPGIYNAFEKLRFLDGSEVQKKDKTDISSFHASYNKHPLDELSGYSQKFSRIRVSEREHISEYRYVSFNEQITVSDGKQIFPIPILDGTITIYPDGSFKTKNIVINSETNELIDRYGYLNDQGFYSNLKLFYQNIKKTFDEESGSFLQLYRHISDNEDGSTTYGAITDNKDLSIKRLIPLPKGIIPVNNGTVEIGADGMLRLTGLVISTEGYRITKQHLHISELYARVDNTIMINRDILDMSTKYYPVIDILQNEEYVSTELKHLTNRGMIKDIGNGYLYHPDNDTYTVTNLENGDVLTVKYKPMAGWDNFRPDTEKGQYQVIEDMAYLSNIFLTNRDGSEEEPLIDKEYYPFTARNSRIEYGNGYIYPKARFNPDGEIDVYITIDHTFFYNHPEKSRGIHHQNHRFLNLGDDYKFYKGLKTTGIISENTDNIDKYFEDNDIIPTKYKDGKSDKFVPYLTAKDEGPEYNNESYYLITKDNNGDYYFKTKGNVIWKRDNEYFTLDTQTIDTEENKVFYNTSWPDIETDENGHYKSLYTVNGYFTDEPIFIRKGHGQGYPWHTNNINNENNERLSPLNIDGVKRQETGLFKLIRRNVTQYLTKLEKQLIDNYKLSNVINIIDENFKIQRIEYITPDTKITSVYQHHDISIHLEYHAFRFSEITPGLFDPVNLYLYRTENTISYGNTSGIEYDRDQEKLYLRDISMLRTPIKLSTGNLLNKSEVLTYYNRLEHHRLDNRSIKQYLSDQETSLYKLEHPEPELLDFHGIRNLTLDNSGAYGTKPKFTVPEKHCLTDGPLFISLDRGNINLKYLYWRTNESTLTYQGSINVTGKYSEVLEINNITLKQRTGYIDIWYDDPFNERSGYTIQRVKLLKDRKLDNLKLTEPESEVTRKAVRLKGEGEPNSQVILYAKDNPNIILKESTVDTNGLWKFNVSDIELIENTWYVIKQIDEWGNENIIEFFVYPVSFKEDDLISVKELMGVQDYVYPLNLRNRFNLSTVPNLVDSRIRFDLRRQTYTIEGIVANTKGQIYPEGMYKIGTAPIPYHSNVLLIEGKTFKPHVNKHGKLWYKLIDGGTYDAKDTIWEEKTHYNAEEIRHDLWIIPKVWIDEMKTMLDEYRSLLDNEDNTIKNNAGEKINILEFIYSRFRDRQLYGSDLSISRYQNKLIFDGQVDLYLPLASIDKPHNEEDMNNERDIHRFSCITVDWNIGNVIEKGLPIRPHGVNPSNETFVREGFTFRNYFTNYFGIITLGNRTIFHPKEINKHFRNKNNPDIPFSIKINDTRRHVNPGNPHHRMIDIINYADGEWEWIDVSNNDSLGDITFPDWFTSSSMQYSLIYSLYNLRKVWDLNHNSNIRDALRLKPSLGYTLRSNYHELSNDIKMSSFAEEHWNGKSFNPSIFTFDNKTNGEVIYHKDGERITITSRVKIDDRYTIPSSQTVSNYNDIQFEPIVYPRMSPRVSHNYHEAENLPKGAYYNNIKRAYFDKYGNRINEAGNYIDWKIFSKIDHNYSDNNRLSRNSVKFNFSYGFALRQDDFEPYEGDFNGRLLIRYSSVITKNGIDEIVTEPRNIVIYDNSEKRNLNYSDFPYGDDTIKPNYPFYNYNKKYTFGDYRGIIISGLIFYVRDIDLSKVDTIEKLVKEFKLEFILDGRVIHEITKEMFVDTYTSYMDVRVVRTDNVVEKLKRRPYADNITVNSLAQNHNDVIG